jgi:predicted lipoprotein with Yx(FWY)xxD motif
MKRLITLATAITTAAALAACGSSSSSAGTARTPAAAGPTDPSGNTVTLRQLAGVGRVLVDPTGKALYTNDLEATGKIVCDTTCNAFWRPLTLNGGTPTASPAAGKLGLITRPGGSRQVTDNGKPLYTFVEDSPGHATGNGFHDEFAGHHFTWNVARPGGTATSAAGSSSGATTPSGTGGSSGSYGY